MGAKEKISSRSFRQKVLRFPSSEAEPVGHLDDRNSLTGGWSNVPPVEGTDQ